MDAAEAKLRDQVGNSAFAIECNLEWLRKRIGDTYGTVLDDMQVSVERLKRISRGEESETR